MVMSPSLQLGQVSEIPSDGVLGHSLLFGAVQTSSYNITATLVYPACMSIQKTLWKCWYWNYCTLYIRMFGVCVFFCYMNLPIDLG